MKTHLTTLFLFLVIPLMGLAQSNTLIIQGDVVNIRNTADVKGELVAKAKQFDILTIIQKDKLDNVNGIQDYWYKVKVGKNVGYVFGHFTSLKMAGQNVASLVFNNAEMGDCFHLIFGDIDFGNGNNNYANYEDLITDESTANSKYLNKIFRITYNDLFTKINESCNPDNPIIIVTTPTIIDILLIQ